jgi:hypothetical protein
MPSTWPSRTAGTGLKWLSDKIKELKKRSNLRNDDRLIADKRAQYDIDLQKLRRELDSFLKEFS